MPYPPQIELLHQTLARLPGVRSVSSGIESLQGLSAGHLSLVELGHLPHAALLRTSGGLAHEALVQIEFHLEPSAVSWRTLEFVAWFIRDQARGGVPLQLSPFALPPQAGPTAQLGNTLRWHIDLFCPNTSKDLTPQLAQVQQVAEALALAIQTYGHLVPVGA